MFLYSGSHRYWHHDAYPGANMEELWRAGSNDSAITDETYMKALGNSAVRVKEMSPIGSVWRWGRPAARYQRYMFLQCARRVKRQHKEMAMSEGLVDDSQGSIASTVQQHMIHPTRPRRPGSFSDRSFLTRCRVH